MLRSHNRLMKAWATGRGSLQGELDFSFSLLLRVYSHYARDVQIPVHLTSVGVLGWPALTWLN